MGLFGQDLLVLKNQALALILNVISWGLQYVPESFYRRSRLCNPSSRVCVAINGPGGLDQLALMDLPQDCIATAGYNIPGVKSPYVMSSAPHAVVYAPDHVLINTSYFSINYADITIRWGLYESALRYVGWPIVPGFDFSGVVAWAGPESGFREGDEVFGFTLFGAYSSRILVPSRQIRKIPRGITHDVAAAIPAVAGTAIHAVSVAGGWPQQRVLTKNKAVLIHSAAGEIY
jgi:hypothetical protein